MKRIFSFLSLLLLFFNIICRADTYVYRHFYSESNEEYGLNTINVGKYIDGKRLIKTRFKEVAEPEHISESDMWLNQNNELINVHVRKLHEKTDYQVSKTGNLVIITGKRKGDLLNKKIEIDEMPLFWDPKFGLSGFVNSDQNSMLFLQIRPGNQEVYEMKAVRKGSKEIEVNGKKVIAIEVFWTLTGFLSLFFEQTYYYRASDSVFLTQKNPRNDITMELLLK